MHIVGILLAIVAGIGVWYWRFKMLGDAGRDAADLIGRVRGVYRTRKFRNAAEGSVLTTVDDPALAAAIFLFTLAGERPPGTRPAIDMVRSELTGRVAADQIEEMISYAEWAARKVADPRDCIRRFTDLWERELTVAQRSDLIQMAENVVGPKPEPHEQLCLDALRTAMEK